MTPTTRTFTASDTATAGEEEVHTDIMMGSSEITEEGLQQFRDGLWYINIHTEMHPDGEIRGQVMEGEADMEPMEAMMGTMGTMGADAMGGDAAAEGNAVLGGEAIRAAVSGNTVQGNMLDSGAYSEFYTADGVIKGEGHRSLDHRR